MNLIDRYKQLPESNTVPDEVWDVQRTLDKMDELRNELNALQLEFTDHQVPKMMTVLKSSWTDEELKAVNLMI